MSLIEKVNANRKKLSVITIVVALVCVAGTAMFPAMAAGNQNSQQTVHKETPVQRGNVTVGISENGTASLEAIAITYDNYSSTSSDSSSTSNAVKALVEEVYVKAGQRVQAGDPIAKLSTAEIEESLATLRQSRKEAALNLEKAILDQKSGTISAKNTLQKRLNDAENADLNYDIEIDSAYSNLTSLKLAYQSAGEKKDDAAYQLDQHKATKTNYETEISDIKKQIADAEAAGDDTSNLQAALASLQAEYDEFMSTYSKVSTSLYNEWVAACKNFDAAKSKYQLADNSISSAEKTAESNRESALSYESNAQTLYEIEICQLNNNVASKKLNLENIDKNIEKLEAYLTDGQVKATCDGLIMNVYVVAGDKVSPNATLASIANSKNIYMSVSIDQEDIANLELGKAANIVLDAYPDKKITGKVDSISVTPAMGSSSTVSYKVNVKLDTEDDNIYEGMTGTVTFITKEVQDVITVSSKAIYTENGQSYVKVKDDSGNITPIAVEVGFSNGIITEIKSGLTEGQTAIIESKVSSNTKNNATSNKTSTASSENSTNNNSFSFGSDAIPQGMPAGGMARPMGG